MLKILGEQMDHFARRARRHFEDRVVIHLCQTRPDLTDDLSEEDLREQVEDAMARAERYGIVMERDAVAFIVVLLELGPAADEELPWLQAILSNRGLDGGGKVERIREAREKQATATAEVSE